VTAGLPLLLAAQQQPTTRLGERIAYTAVVLLLAGLVMALMRRGWRRRAARQADLPPLPATPAPCAAELLAPVAGYYVSSTSAGDWLDRIVVRDLGVPSRAVVRVSAAGVLFERAGASDVFVPAARLRGVRREAGMAGKFVETGGLVVLTWQLGDRLLDTGFRAVRAGDSAALVAATSGLVTAGHAS
jgi:hypothetical protein